MNANVYKKAMSILDGMAEIARNEMLKPGVYISDEVKNEKLAAKGAICGGRYACLVGSMWLSAGIKQKYSEEYDEIELPGIVGQKDFIKNRPALKLVWNTMNEAAERYAEKNGLEGYTATYGEGRAEQIFERFQLRDRREQLKLISSTRRLVNAKR